jgi:hypothetical protein
MLHPSVIDAISAFFSHPFVLMIGSALLAWQLKRMDGKKK